VPTPSGWTRWLVSRTRWWVDVVLEATIGAVFLLAPWATMDVLGIRPAPETAALFRLYGILVICRGFYHHALFRTPDPRVHRRSLYADLFFAVASGVVLTQATLEGLAGPNAWWVVGLFAVEAVTFAAMTVALRGLQVEELREVLARAEARRGQRTSRTSTRGRGARS